MTATKKRLKVYALSPYRANARLALTTKFLLRIFQNFSVFRRQRRQPEAGVGGAGGGEGNGRKTGFRLDELFVKAGRRGAGCENGGDGGFFEQSGNVAGDGISDAGVRCALNVALRKNVPKSNSVPEGESPPFS